MRVKRLSVVVGWAAVVLLAIVGFAAFGPDDPSDPGDAAEAVGPNLGHTTGAYVGLGFAILGSPEGTVPASTSVITDRDVLSLSSSSSDNSDEDAPDIEIEPGIWLSQVDVRALVSAYFEPADVNRAVRVAWCESRFDPDSVDLRTGAVGLFKHLPRYWDERAAQAGFPRAEPSDPEASVAAAAWEVYNGGGWDVFTCRG